MEIKVTADLLDGLVLALLERQDYYGYALTQDMQQAISISESTMYPVLRRLQKNAYVTTYDAPYQGRNRRYYKITERGEHHLERIKKMWNDYKESLDAVFAAVDSYHRTEENEEGQPWIGKDI
ncbi:PadR family transcriptional regulator [Ligilactobacillus faecis]|uniref:PadR family transcriptional regulator n=1 Tax=Ligilactobacillus faecis TaxID=762833 RepID=UPI002469A6CF|nr:PadR family transcriptional regulator [Ligilactobacillus faecis]WGN90228.1 PadR family transcriptional regulator [Ligilactobacillus faecis]